MDGRAECRIERDPTMDNRIVHAVCVSNKKEQCQLRDRERNLQNEFIVEQHIIRREEKSLLKQFQKLQLEKHHRHGDEVHSPRPSYKRLLSPHDTHMARSRHSAHSSLMAKSPMASGHQLSSQRVNLQSAQPSYARIKHGLPSSSHFSSFASSGYSLQSSHDDGSLPNIDGKVRHGASHEYQKRKGRGTAPS
ncbi:hypothetical protein BSL78_16201 [Apostichopus japonicus]|uniref:Uncharacterized protein n=1 Tax=Stichopus japonicus TaxID=307972 RepID=A0A2G8KG14_STIJA|nr:hypothetical protein BSL78_16201 [Apostichopus japonicus]